MSDAYTLITDLAAHQDVPTDGILTRTLCEDDHSKAVLFTFAAGQELSEHTASMPAILHFVSGEADLVLGEDTTRARAGTWVHMPANLKHSIRASSPTIMLLLLLKTTR
jgi:quercetin dioxygenase-like cupin family protein